MKTLIALLLASVVCPFVGVSAEPIPTHFDSVGVDDKAIETLLHIYTTAVSNKDQRLFQTLLLNKDIPFSYVPLPVPADGVNQRTGNYESFRKGVFEGPAFTQRFQNIHIEEDGALAAVSLVFVNTSARGSSWGWKTLQLLKINGKWKIASEFYTGHPG